MTGQFAGQIMLQIRGARSNAESTQSIQPQTFAASELVLCLAFSCPAFSCPSFSPPPLKFLLSDSCTIVLEKSAIKYPQ